MDAVEPLRLRPAEQDDPAGPPVDRSMWHITLTVAGQAVPEPEIKSGLERLSHEHPFLLSGRYARDRAEVRYWEEARRAALPVPDDFGEFWRQLEWMGLQRHLKVLGIFCRLKHRDGKTKYSQDLPRFFAYAHKVATRYNGFGPLAQLPLWAQAGDDPAGSGSQLCG